MSKLCVITNAFSADGFRLSGVEVHAVESAEVARASSSDPRQERRCRTDSDRRELLRHARRAHSGEPG